MELLFIGNSLTQGQIGSSYITLLKADNPSWHVKNAGINGDTLKNISDRVRDEILGTNYDYIIIEAGHNDIILPSFANKSVLFGLAFKYLLKQGRQPLDLSDFKTEYTKMIRDIQSNTSAQIIMTTLSCIGENLATDLNYKRNQYNRAIKSIAQGCHCLLADVAEEFDSLLKTSLQSDYFLDNFFSAVYFDKRASEKLYGPEKLSQKRNLLLTIDGVHPNGNGANVYKKIIENTIKNGC